MKIDIDTLIYIIISIAILVLSGVGGARRRKAQQLNAPAGKSPKPAPGLDAINKIEQMFTGQLGYGNPEQMEVLDEEEILEEAVIEEEPPKVEMFLKGEGQFQSRLEEGRISADYKDEDNDKLQEDESRRMVGELFTDVDEIKKAVIYSEIFQRKYT